MSAAAPLLCVRDLHVRFETELGAVDAVSGVTFDVRPNEVLAIVGESGSGKSATALSLMGLTREAGASLGGSVRFEGVEMLSAPLRQLRLLRGAQISIVFQDPLSSLNPVHRIGQQIVEQVRAHSTLSREEAEAQALSALARAGMDDPRRRISAYPHQLSGGQRQRAMIAMALCCHPRLLVADEPTTALDVTVQAEILKELSRLREQTGTSIVLVSHDLAVVSGIADRVLVMHEGQIVEQGATETIFQRPKHPVTKALLAAAEVHRPAAQAGGAAPAGGAGRATSQTSLGRPGPPQGPGPLLRLQDVSASYETGRSGRRGARRPPGRRDGGRSGRRGAAPALDGVSVEVLRGETLGVVGPSGCGKTTLIRVAARLIDADCGSIAFDGVDITGAGRRALRPVRQRMQVVFQDPDSSLNPRRRVEQILAVPLRLRGVGRGEVQGEVESLLAEVGLPAAHASRFPHELSGGQRQRVGIARALALAPQLLLLDEPVSSLDVTVRAQIVGLLRSLSERRGLSCLFVAHDIALLRGICDRIAVMHSGRIVEMGRTEEVWQRPQRPETKALLAAVPTPPPAPPGPAPPGPAPSDPGDGSRLAARVRSSRADAA